MKIHLLLSSLLLALALETSAQVTVKRYSPDDQTGQTTQTKSSSRQRVERYPTALKYNIGSFFAGHYPISLEQRLSPFITAEVGLGLTLNNTTDGFFSELLYFDNFFYSSSSKVRMGGSQMMNVKFFPSGDAYNDALYFGFFLQNKEHNRKFAGINQDFVSFKRTFDQGLMLGYQIRSSKQVMVDLSVGLSNRFVNFPKVIESTTIDPTTGELNVVFDLIPEANKYQTIGLIGGLKIAYLLKERR
jgi:hypothetical protein